MLKTLRYIFIVLLLLMLPSTSLASPLVRIGIINGKETATISGQRSFNIVQLSDGAVVAKGDAGEKWELAQVGEHLYLNNKRLNTPVVFRLEAGHENEYLTVNGRRYRGDIEVRLSVTKKGITVIETLPMEEYIYGIIALEISPAWSVEAVKAQAVAARTYALYHLGKHRKDGFDLCSTTDCQVYGGREAEDSRGNFAVDATRGMVVTYKDKLIPAFFHSSGGGYTENSENVWGNKADYLRAVPDYDQNSPQFKWKITFTAEEIASRLQGMGYKIGTLDAIKLSTLHNGANDAPDRGISGRVKSVTFIGSKQTIVLAGNEVRRILKLNSTLFDIMPAGNPNPSPEVNISTSILLGTDKVEAKQTIMLTPKLKKQKNKTVTQSTVKPKREEPATRLLTGMPINSSVTFEGRGFGHGLGMSQWGAKAMAEQGPSDDHTYYQQILKHYYQGVDISKWY